MGVRVTFSCDGCEAEAPGLDLLRQIEVPAMGGGYYVSTNKVALSEITPPYWVAFDPYTAMTYCPECWASIIGESVVQSTSTQAKETTP